MDERLGDVEEELTFDKAVSGDRPSLYVLGMAASESLKQMKFAVFMVDVLGRIRLMPQESVKVLSTPKVDDTDLNALPDTKAIELMVAQGDSEEAILSYLTRRKSVEG